MAGLDKIISQIKEESQKAAERTRAEARSKADEILAQARADAERECVETGGSQHSGERTHGSRT